MDLKEWTSIYVKHKDIIKKNIIKEEDKGSHIEYEYKNHIKHSYFIIPELNNADIDNINKKDFTTIVTRNKKENLDFLISEWEKLKEFPNMTFIFVNQELNTKWVIKPYTHHKISDEKSLVRGLTAMFYRCEGIEQQ
ncbi:hypothetical protein JW949_04215 [Candidatus Woesearchaeota archaeon]|jgi:hypothetical protein|nr:hypothetical protein [Candidatus Woesearchaeota archaeon]